MQATKEYGSLARYDLFINQFAASETAARRGLALDGTQTWVKTNLCHALLFQNKDADAKAAYNALKTQKDNLGENYRDVFLEDIKTLRAAGLDAAQLDKAEKWMKEE